MQRFPDQTLHVLKFSYTSCLLKKSSSGLVIQVFSTSMDEDITSDGLELVWWCNISKTCQVVDQKISYREQCLDVATCCDLKVVQCPMMQDWQNKLHFCSVQKGQK